MYFSYLHYTRIFSKKKICSLDLNYVLTFLCFANTYFFIYRFLSSVLLDKQQIPFAWFQDNSVPDWAFHLKNKSRP